MNSEKYLTQGLQEQICTHESPTIFIILILIQTPWKGLLVG